MLHVRAPQAPRVRSRSFAAARRPGRTALVHRGALLAVATACGLLIAGCAGFKVRSDFDREMDFSSYETFAWIEPPIREPQQLPAEAPAAEVLIRNSLLDKRLRAAVTAALEQRGLAYVPEGEADLLLRYRVAVDEQTELYGGTIGTGAYWGYYRYPWYVSPGIDTYWSSRNVVNAVLILDMVDAETGQLVWRGWAAGRNPDAYFEEEELAEAVAALMARYPPERGEDD